MDLPFYDLPVGPQDLVGHETACFRRARGIRSARRADIAGSVSSPLGPGSESQPVRINLFDIQVYPANSARFPLEYGTHPTSADGHHRTPGFVGENADATHPGRLFHRQIAVNDTSNDVVAAAEAGVRRPASAVMTVPCDEPRRTAGRTAHIKTFPGATTPRTPRTTFEEAPDGVLNPA
ncbi:hypothetical protein [Streptantibioticus silvisoli]|uniref:Uncharacterized protein n=1 Tax=Streptantibioticus silvisoli TaxID=2705255 RepID=A0ABT6VRL9_9ACTN|nr:hypothetical protein [Streptantibioticus silvisoli]MDI5961125.1 hypothetical protein [Streptantibioticus silvisoli]